MKKLQLPILVLLMFAFYSCSENEFEQQNNETEATDLQADLSAYSGTAQGLYKGVFSTASSTKRATVEIKIISARKAQALLSYSTGRVEFFEGRVLPNQFRHKTSIAFNSPRSSFTFSVDQNGENPIIVDALSNSEASFIKVVKELTRDAVTPVTGTFTTDANSSAEKSGTWNLIFNSGDDEDANTDLTTMVILNGNDFGSATGSEQLACVAVGNKADCPISGSYTTNGIPISYSGEHTFLNRNDCSSVEGTWTAGSGLSGTFKGDSNCNGTGEVIITEIHNRPQRPSTEEMTVATADPANMGSPGNTDLRGDGSGQEQHAEWFEIYNTTNSPIVMDGWKFTDASGSGSYTVDSFTLGAGSYAALAGYNVPPANGGVIFDHFYTYKELSFNNESTYSGGGDSCPDGIVLTKPDTVTTNEDGSTTTEDGPLVDQVLYDYGYGAYIGNIDSSSRCRDNDIPIGIPAQGSSSRTSFQLVNNPAVMNSLDNDDAANWTFSTVTYDTDNNQKGSPGTANEM